MAQKIKACYYTGDAIHLNGLSFKTSIISKSLSEEIIRNSEHDIFHVPILFVNTGSRMSSDIPHFKEYEVQSRINLNILI